jgi:hypothetical protein
VLPNSLNIKTTECPFHTIYFILLAYFAFHPIAYSSMCALLECMVSLAECLRTGTGPGLGSGKGFGWTFGLGFARFRALAPAGHGQIASRITIYFLIFFLTYLSCSQIWLNPPMDCCHLWLNHKSEKKKKKKKTPDPTR